MDLTAAIQSLPTAWVPYATAFVAVCAAVATVLPTPAVPSSGVYPLVYHFINFFALNVGKAKNAGAAP